MRRPFARPSTRRSSWRRPMGVMAPGGSSMAYSAPSLRREVHRPPGNQGTSGPRRPAPQHVRKLQNQRRPSTVATVYERVRKIVVDQLGVDEDEVVPSASFVDDLNAVSLALVELIMSLEEEFTAENRTVEISDEDAEKIATVQDAVDYIKDKGIEDEA